MQNDLTKGSIFHLIIRFSIPYLISCFLQTFYGLADLFIAGQFNGAAVISAVSIGSQVMHMVTVVLVGLAMGTTVTISRAVGAKMPDRAAKCIGNTILIFSMIAVALTIVLLIAENGIISILSTPEEAVSETYRYLVICFAGIPFITAYNIIASIFRGLGDSRRPMYFIAIAGVINIVLDYIFMGPLGMGARGAALGTVLSQAVSVIVSLIAIVKLDFGMKLRRADAKPDSSMIRTILKTGFPIACQDGFVQIAFLVITVIANQRGVVAAASVGIVEKIISFLFLVPSAMLSTVSVISAQNAGAGLHERGLKTLKYALIICWTFGAVITVICQFEAEGFIRLFSPNNDEVVRMGAQYLRSYVFDTIFAGTHFCFSGYFTAYNRAILSFIHNAVSITTARIPLAYLFSKMYPTTLWPMGWATPIGSAESAILCVIFFAAWHKKWIAEEETPQS
ncbi:MAG: MATE family efflux transporter [Anaerovoracaceae bacterium]|jgi:putative MATE family efflux protein